jgi:hypothetical protein
MCDTPRPPDPTIARPRWVLLYGAAFSPLAALAVVEVATPPNGVRTLLCCILAMVVFAGMAVWVRGSDGPRHARLVRMCRRDRVGAGDRV